jgi:STE24 endopeptidase
MRRTRWWVLWGTVAVAPLVVCYLVVAPVVLDPLFNRFRPYKDAAAIVQLADEQGAHVGEVYVVDRSRQTKKVNAYVTGLFGTTRIVLWDTLIREFPPDEAEFVLAHEIGHYVRHDVWKGAATAVVVIGLALGFVKLVSRRLVWRCQARLGYDDPRCPASLPLLGLLFLVAVFVLTPAYSAVSRHIERQADAFALAATQNPDAAVRALRKLGELNLADPNPPRFIVWWMFDHPPVAERIEAVRATDEPGPPGDAQRLMESGSRPAGVGTRIDTDKDQRERHANRGLTRIQIPRRRAGMPDLRVTKSEFRNPKSEIGCYNRAGRCLWWTR